MKRAKNVDEYIELHPEWAGALRKLRRILQSSELEETVKWGGPCYTLAGKNVVGIGNIYASETCFLAGVRPGRAARRLTRADCERVADAAATILGKAIAAGGTTIRDYIGVDEDTGYFQRELMVYDRKDEPCRLCRTPIKRTVAMGRSTYYCPACQG